MGRINVRKKFILDGVDEDWTKDHYVLMNNFKFKDLAKFNKLNVKDVAEIDESNLDSIVDILKQKFVEGSVLVSIDEADPFGPKETASMVADDLDDLPAGVINTIIEWAMGKLSQTSNVNSNSQSSKTEVTAKI